MTLEAVIVGGFAVAFVVIIAKTLFRGPYRKRGPHDNWTNEALGGTKFKSDQSKDGALDNAWLRGGNS